VARALAGLLIPNGSRLSVHPLVIAAELYRCRCSHYHTYSTGGGYGNYWIASWLWHELHWWLLLAVAPFVLLAVWLAPSSGSDC
jgi:hypothetical protein